MEKHYRLTLDFEIEINEKVKVPGANGENGDNEGIKDEEDNEEYPADMLEKSQHIINAFLMNPGVLHEFIRYRIFLGIFDDEYIETIRELLAVKLDEENLPVLFKDLPQQTIPYLAGIERINDINFPGTQKEESIAKYLLEYQLGYFVPCRATLEEISEKGEAAAESENVRPHGSAVPVNAQRGCPGECQLIQKLRALFQGEKECA